MTFTIKTIQTFELQTTHPTSHHEGLINIIPTEIIEGILFLTSHGESTRLVSRIWKDLTLTADSDSNSYELKQTIRLITEKLNPDTHAECITDLADVQAAHQSLSRYVATFSEVRRLFLINKGFVIGILRKLPEEERDQLQIAIAHQLFDSMKDLLEISKLDLETVEDVDLDTFFTLLQSYHPLSIYARGLAIFQTAKINNIEFAKLILADGPISEWYLEMAVWVAAEKGELEFVKLLLDNGSISERYQGYAVWDAVCANHTEVVRFLLANGPISEDHRRRAIIQAADNDNIELVKLLQD